MDKQAYSVDGRINGQVSYITQAPSYEEAKRVGELALLDRHHPIDDVLVYGNHENGRCLLAQRRCFEGYWRIAD